jgi:hypothetical protein
LEHENGEARTFYAGLREPALVGIESMGYTQWFEELLAEGGHELVVGDAAKIRKMEVRKQKHDRRDAEHLLNLLVKGDFPRLCATTRSTLRQRLPFLGSLKVSCPPGAGVAAFQIAALPVSHGLQPGVSVPSPALSLPLHAGRP